MLLLDVIMFSLVSISQVIVEKAECFAVVKRGYTVVSRMVIFPDKTFPGKTIPGWSLSRKDVSRVVIFPDETFPRKTS